MTKRKISFALMLMAVVAGLILAMFPAAAMAAPGIDDLNFSEATFEGADAFYDTGVVAYTPGSTAKIEFRVHNDQAADIKITGGSIEFDWGSCSPVTPAAFPFVLKGHDYAIFRFECVVPADASNQVLHAYRAIVSYEGDNGPSKVNNMFWEDVPGAGVTYTLVQHPIVPDSETIYLEDTAANTVNALALNSGYALNDYTGTITFTAAPTVNVRASYKYMETVIHGDGSTLVGYLAHVPVVPASVVVCVDDSVAETITTVAAAGYTVDPATGKLTMATAPTSWQHVVVYYQYYNTLTSTGSNFAVVSQDQADYTTLWRRYKELYDSEYYGGYITGAANQQWGEAESARMKAEIQYREGKFADAKASMQTALDKETAAIASETAMYTSVQNGLTGLLTSAQPVVDAYAAKLNAEAKESKGQATMYSNVGVFAIMLGVAVLLAALAGIIWAYSRLVEAKRPGAG